MLFIVSTPIGNLDDLSIRQAKILSLSDVVLAEDTRSTGILLQQISKKFNFSRNPSQKLISYYKEKEFEKLPEIIKMLVDGKTVSLVSESGMPLISDPGYLLVKTVIKQGLSFTVVPGASASTTALIYSGFPTDQFLFLGFLPKKRSQKAKFLNSLKQIKKILPDLTTVFYESPKRVAETMEILNEIMPEVEVCICRELTKMFEEIIRAKPKELINKSYKGEITVVLH